MAPWRLRGSRWGATWWPCLVLALMIGCVPDTAAEVQMGNTYAAELERELPILRDPAVDRFLQELGTRITRTADTRKLTWHFRVVDAPDINAFAVPGGHIYVYRGLIERAGTMAELAGVLAHEVAHVTQRHSVEQMVATQRTNLGLTGLCLVISSLCDGVAGAGVRVLASAGFAKFSRDDEAEADSLGVRYVTAAEIDPRGIPRMFRTMMATRDKDPTAVEAFFASHPVEERRIAATEMAVAALPSDQLRTFTRDTPAFQAFKARLGALPTVPAPAQLPR